MNSSSSSANKPLLWDVTIGVFNDFIWADLRDGIVRLDGVSTSVKMIVFSGFATILFMLGVIVQNQVIRNNGELVSLSYGGATVGRGALIPQLLTPLTLFVLALSWSFLLAGCIRIRRSLKFSLLLLYFLSLYPLFFGFIGSIGVAFVNITRIVQFLVAIGCYLLAPLFVIIRSFGRSRPTFEFVILFALLGSFFGMVQFSILASDQEFGINIGYSVLEIQMFSLVLVVLAFVISLGVEIAKFVRKAAVWSGQIVWHRMPRWILFPLLGLVVIWQVINAGQNGWIYFQSHTFADAILAYIGAGLVVVTVWAAWWLIRRLNKIERPFLFTESDLDETLDHYAPRLILALFFLPFLNFLLLQLLPFFAVLEGTIISASVTQPLTRLTNQILEVDHGVTIGIGIAAVGVGLWLGLQKRPLSGLYILLVGALLFWYRMTDPGKGLDFFGWEGSTPVDFWWVMLLVGITAVWYRRRTLTPERAVHLILLFLITALLQQSDFIEDPFSPFLSFAGVGFLAFAVLWDVLTIGSWANENSATFPRLSRIYLYLGYVLLSVATINWAFSQHNLFMVEQFSGNGALLGLDFVGRPMLYILFPLLLRHSPTAVWGIEPEGRGSTVS